MTLLQVTRPATGPRLYVLGRLRIHHGMSGMLAATVGVLKHNRLAVVLGLAAAIADRHDFPWCSD